MDQCLNAQLCMCRWCWTLWSMFKYPAVCADTHVCFDTHTRALTLIYSHCVLVNFKVSNSKYKINNAERGPWNINYIYFNLGAHESRQTCLSQILRRQCCLHESTTCSWTVGSLAWWYCSKRMIVVHIIWRQTSGEVGETMNKKLTGRVTFVQHPGPSGMLWSM